MNDKDFLLLGTTKETYHYYYVEGFFYIGFKNSIIPFKYERKVIEKNIPYEYQTGYGREQFDQSDYDEDRFISPPLPDDDSILLIQHDEYITEKRSNLVLLIKAEAGAQLINKIKKNNKLLSEFSNDLFLYTMRLWVGNENDKQMAACFKKNANSGIVQKNDFVMFRFKFNDAYEGYAPNEERYNRIEFFKTICKDELVLIEASARLAFDDSQDTGSWER